MTIDVKRIGISNGLLQAVSRGARHVGATARYLRTGHLVYPKARTLMAVPFDAAKLETQGAPVPVLEGGAAQSRWTRCPESCRPPVAAAFYKRISAAEFAAYPHFVAAQNPMYTPLTAKGISSNSKSTNASAESREVRAIRAFSGNASCC
jgi:hypothetical protein